MKANRLQLEFKKYMYTKINTNGFSSNYYLGLQYFIKKQSYDFHDTISIINTSSYHKYYNVKKMTQGLSLIYGKQYRYKNRWFFDLMVGIGVRHKSQNNALTEIEEKYIDKGEADGMSEHLMNDTYHGFLPHILLGGKIGFNVLK